MTHTLLFDFGGTIDTDGTHWYDMFRAAYQRHFPHLDEESIRQAYVQTEQLLEKERLIQAHHDFDDTLRIKLHLHAEQLSLPQAAVDDIHKELTAAVATTIRRNKEVIAALHKCHRLGIVSNFYGNLRRVLQQYQLADYFALVVDSALVGYRKPSVEIYRYALDALHAEACDTTMIGDSVKNDIQPVLSLGMNAVWLCPVRQQSAPYPQITTLQSLLSGA